MKPITLLKVATAASFLGFLTPSTANMVNQIINWNGDSGYSATIEMVFDDSFGIVSGNSTGLTNGIEEFTVSFYNPSLSLLATHDNVDAGMSTYDYFEFYFNTVTLDFINGNDFDIGKDNTGIGEWYLSGTYGDYSDLSDVEMDVDNDSTSSGNDGFHVGATTPVPLPNTLALINSSTRL